jgi:hypothetical protein
MLWWAGSQDEEMDDELGTLQYLNYPEYTIRRFYSLQITNVTNVQQDSRHLQCLRWQNSVANDMGYLDCGR